MSLIGEAFLFATFLLTAQVSDAQQELAAQLWAEFEQVAWDTSYRDWVNSRPAAICQSPTSDGSDQEWCNQCATQHDSHEQQWAFYALDLREPLACRLMEYGVRSTENHWEYLADVHRILTERLTARYGRAQTYLGVPQHFPAGYPPGWTWKAADLQVWLHLDLLDPENHGLAVLRIEVRRGMLATENQQDRFEAELLPEISHRKAGTPLDLALADALRAEFPEVADMLRSQIPTPDEEKLRAAMEQYQANHRSANPEELRANIGKLLNRQWSPEDFYRESTLLLSKAESAEPERRAALMLSAERLLTRILHPNSAARVELQNEWLQEWERRGITFENLRSNSRFPPVWEYDHDLLWRVWSELPETSWGERAFVALLEHGWHTKPTCGGSSDPSQPSWYNRGDDLFHEVIEQGEGFLEYRPNSLQSREVMLLLAQAYETWWSLSLATDDSYVPDATKYHDGAEGARQKAVAYYERVLQLAPAPDLVSYVMRHLPRLKLQVDTEQQRFYCVLRD